MLSSLEQAFLGRDEKRAPLKTPAWEAREGELQENFEKIGLSYEGKQNYHKNYENCITVPRTFVLYYCYQAFQRPPGRLGTRIARLPVYCLHCSKSSRLRRYHSRYGTYLMFCT